MAVNIRTGLNFVVALTTAPWNMIPFTVEDTVEIYATIDGNPVSWRPGRTINTLNAAGIVAQTGYQITSKMDRDLTAFFSPPTPAGTGTGGGTGIVTLS